jgi:DNA-binding transcriptional regulator YbjK
MTIQPAPQSRSRPHRRGAQRRAALLDAAIRIIGRHGLEAVTHRAVAAEAGLPAASTSYYFRSKDELVDEALRAIAEREVALLSERREALGEAAADVDTIVEALASWIEEQIAPDGRVALLAQDHLQIESARRPAARTILEDWKSGTDELTEAVLARLGARDARTAGIILISAIDGLRLRLIASGHEPLDAAELRRVLDALLRGLL